MAKWTTGGDVSVGGGKFLTKGDDGCYHFCITTARDGGVKHQGEIIDNAFMQIECEVVASLVEANVGKTWDHVFYYPKPSSKDEGKFTKKMVDRFLLATSMFTQEQIEAAAAEGKDLEFDTEKLVGRQFKAKLVTEKGTDGKDYLKLSFTDLYHVDDPAVKDWPVNKEYLKPSFFPPEWRWDPAKKKAATPKSPAKKPPTDSVAKGGVKTDFI